MSVYVAVYFLFILLFLNMIAVFYETDEETEEAKRKKTLNRIDDEASEIEVKCVNRCRFVKERAYKPLT